MVAPFVSLLQRGLQSKHIKVLRKACANGNYIYDFFRSKSCARASCACLWGWGSTCRPSINRCPPLSRASSNWSANLSTSTGNSFTINNLNADCCDLTLFTLQLHHGGTSKAMLELNQSCFKVQLILDAVTYTLTDILQFITSVLREHQGQSVTGSQLKLLLSLVQGTMLDSDQQPTALALLKVCSDPTFALL